MKVKSHQAEWDITPSPYGVCIYVQSDSLRGGRGLDNPDARETLATRGLRVDVDLRAWDEIDAAIRAALETTP